MRKIGYGRVSTARQDTELQRDQLIDAGVLPGDLYLENASGKNADRPQLQAAIESLRSGDLLIITKLDRLARSTRDLLDLSDRVDKVGAGLRVLDQPEIDTTTSMGRFLFTILGAVAQFERDLIVARTRAGQNRARAQGKHVGRPPALSEVQLEEFQARLEAGESAYSAAKAMGISTSAAYRFKAQLGGGQPRL